VSADAMKSTLITVVIVVLIVLGKGYLKARDTQITFDQDYLQGQWTYSADGLSDGARMLAVGRMTVSGDSFSDQLMLKTLNGEEVAMKATIVTSGTIQAIGSGLYHNMTDVKVTKFWSKDESMTAEILMQSLLDSNEGSSTLVSFEKGSFIAQEAVSGIEFHYQRVAE